MNETKLDLLLGYSTTLIDEIKSIGKKVDGLESKVDRLETGMNDLNSRMDHLETRMDGLETRMDGLESRMDHLETDVTQVKQQLTNIELTLEHETNPNIRIIAEGHVDLIRKLDESLKVNQESEMYQIKVNKLDADIRKIREFYKNQSSNQRAAAN